MPNGLTNAEYLKQLRAAAAVKGLCYSCRARPCKPGLRRCQVCLDASYAYRTSNPKGIKAEASRNRASASRRRARYRASGMCHQCGKRPPMARRAACQPCLDSNASRTAKSTRSAGHSPTNRQCTVCGQPGHTAQRHARDVATVASPDPCVTS